MHDSTMDYGRQESVCMSTVLQRNQRSSDSGGERLFDRGSIRVLRGASFALFNYASPSTRLLGCQHVSACTASRYSRSAGLWALLINHGCKLGYLT
ncbi:hypothetical protein CC2G_012135 [Coprinopsis cinerea AmutBmut pab1-1]|nr:hypothetical protein CC2G_012135 [Coprinopsis cinerea AmutBmut pab1-1]